MKRYVQLAAIVLVGALAAPGGFASGTKESGSAASTKVVPLRWVIPGTPPAELGLGIDAVNKKLAEEALRILYQRKAFREETGTDEEHYPQRKPPPPPPRPRPTGSGTASRQPALP